MSKKCGTYAGWNAHRRAQEPQCDACREAARVYQRERRAKGGEQIESETTKQRCRERALWRLKEMHRGDFDLLVADEIRVEQKLKRRERESA